MQRADVIAQALEHEGRGGRALAGVAVDDHAAARGQCAGDVFAQPVQRHVDGTINGALRVLFRHAHVHQRRAQLGQLGGLRRQHPGQHRRLEHGLEGVARQAHQHAALHHAHGGVARQVRQQRVFAKGVALAQVGHHLRGAVEVLGHRGGAFAHHVEIVRGVAFAHHDLAGLDVHRFEQLEHLLDVAGGQARERLAAQQAEHPVVAAGAGAVMAVVLVAAELVPGDELLEVAPVNAHHARLARHHLGGEAARHGVVERIAAVRCAGHVGHAAAIGIVAAQLAVEQVDGVVVEVAGFEHVLAAGVVGHGGFAGQLVPGFLAQGFQREQAGQVGGGDGHGADSCSSGFESIAGEGFWGSGVWASAPGRQ